jgi:pSer/pThr/pTyr-binding forkhead associated (FHA) protein
MNLYILNGPEIGRPFELEEGVSFLGRSLENDIRIQDKTVSRKHLKIVVKGDRYFITDLKSQNRTCYDGKYLTPGEEVEIVEGVPIAIGMTVICLGESCKDKMAPYLDTVTLIRGKETGGGGFEDRRKRTYQKRGALINKVSIILKEDVPLMQMLGEVLEQIFHHLKRIDRGVFVLVDLGNAKAKSVICKFSKSGEDNKATYSEKVVENVLKTGRPVVYSKSYVEDRNGVVDTLKILKIQSVMCLPLIGGSGVLGALYLDSLMRPDGFRKYDLLDLWDIAQRIAVTVESYRFEADILEVVRNLGGDDKPWGKETKKKK